MKVLYDEETDSLSITLREALYSESEEVEPNIVFDYANDGKIMGIDIEHAGQVVDVSNLPRLREK